jgi:hypothetical protein
MVFGVPNATLKEYETVFEELFHAKVKDREISKLFTTKGINRKQVDRNG